MGRSKKKKRQPTENGQQSNSAAKKLAAQIEELEFVTVTGLQQTEDRVRIRIRIDEDENPSWIKLSKFVLREERRQRDSKNAWAAHICSQLVVREDPPHKLAYAWNVIIRADNIDRAISDVCRIIDVASNAVIMGEEEPARRRPGRIPTPSRGRQRALNHARRWKAPESVVRGGRRGQELREYDLGADHIVPEVGLMAPQGKRKGAHLIGG